MVSSSDFIYIPYTTALTEGRIAYALRSLSYSFDGAGGPPYERIRRLVAGVTVELAFGCYLSLQDIPYEVKGATHLPTWIDTMSHCEDADAISNPNK